MSEHLTPVATVTKHTGDLKDMAIITWLVEQPAEGTVLYTLGATPRGDDHRQDAAFLRSLAARMTYNDSEPEAIEKHRLYEIAMRIETGYYCRTALTEGPQ